MDVIADLHVHSRHARACSKDLNIPMIEKFARLKGLSLCGTGDFTHPLWFKELKEKLVREEAGIYYTASGFPFVCQTEISLVYTQGKGRRIHQIVLAPSLEVVQQITDELLKHGRVDYDGRPIFKIPSPDFVEMLLSISPDVEVIPAHIWTPWFALFGSKSGFDSVQDCFQDQTKHIHAIETGISSDPSMNWRLSQLDKLSIVSFSDAHCVHPDTMITLGDGYVLPISEIGNEPLIAHANLKDLSFMNSSKTQYAVIPSPAFLKEISCTGAKIKVSDKHRFFVVDNGAVVERFAYELKKGDLLLRLARIPHTPLVSPTFKEPVFDKFFSVELEGLLFIKVQRNKQGLNQKKVAGLLGIYVNHYWKIENGLVKLNDELLKKLVKILCFGYSQFVKKFAVGSENSVFSTTSSVKLCELLGYFAGDGCFTKRNRGRVLYFTDKHESVLRYYKRIVLDLFSCDAKIFKSSFSNSYSLVLPARVAAFFSLNFPELVLKSKKRRVPRWLYGVCLDEISGFLRGFFDAEGSCSNHYVSACSANKLLLCQVDSLLKKFGVFSSLNLYQFEKVKKKYRHRIFLYGENLRVFFEHIGFNHSVKKCKLKKYVEKLVITRKSKIKRFGDFIVTPVVSIKTVKSDVSHLYDLSVPGYENYIADQLVVHNSHWPWRLGREATVFDVKKLSYTEIIHAIREQKIKETLEFFPEEGKYHVDGHRKCNVCLMPSESMRLKNICPACKKPLTIGVLHRIEELADRPEGFVAKSRPPFRRLVPLAELIAASFGKGVMSKHVQEMYRTLVADCSELDVLLKMSLEEVEKLAGEKISSIIKRLREQKLQFSPGYDGEYGRLML